VIVLETKLKQILVERGLKQGFIAEKSGLTPGAFSLIVRGKSLPTLPVAIRIARSLDETVESLWGYMIE
jgi:DNA-binding XRE family transcriptional regulator